MKKLIACLGVLGLFLVLTGCGNMPETGESTMTEMEQTEKNHQRLVAAVPPPVLKTSQERKNLVKRLERFNSEDKQSFIYLVDYGKIMAYYPVLGKVSSVNSMLTTTEQLVVRRIASGNYEAVTLPSPDLDGSYGSNGDAIFFFTDTDAYVEWNGTYMLSDQPLKLSQPPELQIIVDEKP